MSTLDDTAVSTLDQGVWDIDPEHSNVDFVARHLLSRVRGRFTDFAGTITVGPDGPGSSVEAAIQAASIDTHHEERDGHLRSPEFLDVERYPTVSFRSTAISPLDGGRTRLEGDLTIRDVSRPVALDIKYLGASDDPWGGRRAGFSAGTEIDRDDFGANWNVVLETGGLLVGKRVQVELEIEAVLRRG